MVVLELVVFCAERSTSASGWNDIDDVMLWCWDGGAGCGEGLSDVLVETEASSSLSSLSSLLSLD